MFWPIFRIAGVFENAAQDGEGFFDGDLVRSAQVVMAEREIERLARLEGERHSDKAGPGREDIVRFRIERDESRLS